ncbi:hypothetical protein EDD22DRAFT_919190 [Suillus occidentalis]|nr:hypothetical protein EDD22DRAFT_919190 [Suillus occidentalis]
MEMGLSSLLEFVASVLVMITFASRKLRCLLLRKCHRSNIQGCITERSNSYNRCLVSVHDITYSWTFQCCGRKTLSCYTLRNYQLEWK